MPLSLQAPPDPELGARAFTATFAGPLDAAGGRERIARWLMLDAPAPVASSDAVRAAVRDLLRRGGYKPTGRGKPASEYLLRAATEGALGSINAAVDACNAVSLHSGLPISVVDLDLARAPLSIVVAERGASYVFNASGQTIDLGGLLCLADADGPCANAVKDAQRTKTSGATRRTLTVVWAPASLGDLAERSLAWYRELLAEAGAALELVTIER